MAEAIFRHMASKRLECETDQLRSHGIDTFSAGIAAGNNLPASSEAVELLRDRGIDLSQHLSQQVTAEMLSESDHVFAMTNSHLDVLSNARPDLTGRMHLVTPNGRDISDPIGGGPEVYRECADQLTEAIQHITEELIRKDAAGT